MPDPAWTKLVNNVLANVEPNPVLRRLLEDRLRRAGELSMLHSMWSQDTTSTAIGRAMEHLAQQRR